MLKAHVEANPGLYELVKESLSITGKVSKTVLKAAFKDGEEIEGAHIDETANYLKFT
jgi:hypothetical protein